jgi:hypothetical protein
MRRVPGGAQRRLVRRRAQAEAVDALMDIPPIPEELCGAGGCTFLIGHVGIHTWQFELYDGRRRGDELRRKKRKLTQRQ